MNIISFYFVKSYFILPLLLHSMLYMLRLHEMQASQPTELWHYYIPPSRLFCIIIPSLLLFQNPKNTFLFPALSKQTTKPPGKQYILYQNDIQASYSMPQTSCLRHPSLDTVLSAYIPESASQHRYRQIPDAGIPLSYGW